MWPERRSEDCTRTVSALDMAFVKPKENIVESSRRGPILNLNCSLGSISLNASSCNALPHKRNQNQRERHDARSERWSVSFLLGAWRPPGPLKILFLEPTTLVRALGGPYYFHKARNSSLYFNGCQKLWLHLRYWWSNYIGRARSYIAT